MSSEPPAWRHRGRQGGSPGARPVPATSHLPREQPGSACDGEMGNPEKPPRCPLDFLELGFPFQMPPLLPGVRTSRAVLRPELPGTLTRKRRRSCLQPHCSTGTAATALKGTEWSPENRNPARWQRRQWQNRQWHCLAGQPTHLLQPPGLRAREGQAGSASGWGLRTPAAHSTLIGGRQRTGLSSRPPHSGQPGRSPARGPASGASLGGRNLASRLFLNL